MREKPCDEDHEENGGCPGTMYLEDAVTGDEVTGYFWLCDTCERTQDYEPPCDWD